MPIVLLLLVVVIPLALYLDRGESDQDKAKDPDITLDNAEYQLDRVSAAWAKDTKRDQGQMRTEIEQMVQADVDAPVGGLFGEKFINVLQINLALRNKYGQPQ